MNIVVLCDQEDCKFNPKPQGFCKNMKPVFTRRNIISGKGLYERYCLSKSIVIHHDTKQE